MKLARELIKLPNIGNVGINENGTKLYYVLIFNNLNKNKKEMHLRVRNIQTAEEYLLVKSESISNIKWQGNNLLLLKSEGDSSKIYYYENANGEGIALDLDMKINSFKITDEHLLILIDDKKLNENRENIYGKYIHEEEEVPLEKLIYINLKKQLIFQKEKLFVTKDVEKKIDIVEIINSEYNIGKIENYEYINPGIIITTRKRADLLYLLDTSNYFININFDDTNFDEFKLDKERIQKIMLPPGSRFLQYYQNLIFSCRDGLNRFQQQPDLIFLKREDLSLDEIDLKEKIKLNSITRNYDFWPDLLGISNEWLLIHYHWMTGANLGVFNSELIEFDFDSKIVADAKCNRHGDIVAVLDGPEQLPELVLIKNIWRDKVALRKKHSELNWKHTDYKPNQVEIKLKVDYEVIHETKLDNKIIIPKVETIKWKSDDELEIEGILRKPINFDKNKKYPLVFIVHGGPTWLVMKTLTSRYDKFYYPGIEFSLNDIMVVYPNYRGSLGRGQKFLDIYGENMGFGEMNDIHSCINYLEENVDVENVGIMGWSQGGYISAFMSTHSNKIKAVSVGAGISSWYTYYINNDIRQWTTDYLGATPLENPEIYKKTAPMNKISQSETPTLIQHGENDRRVPISNARELYRTLKEKGVLTHLFIFKNKPHGINTPLENLLILNQNFQWFMHHLKNSELDFSG